MYSEFVHANKRRKKKDFRYIACLSYSGSHQKVRREGEVGSNGQTVKYNGEERVLNSTTLIVDLNFNENFSVLRRNVFVASRAVGHFISNESAKQSRAEFI